MAKFKLYLLNLHPSSGTFSVMSTRILISEFEIVSHQYEDDLINYWTTAENVENREYLRNRQTATLFHNPHFCYTSDEKFQLHQNTQRTLTFSMARDVIREDRIEKNPFINYLYVGAQLLLEDKYDKHHLMTVSKISYEFHKLNTIFKYECQDSFNYQLARQNSGYEITNNIEDVDFIGAKPLDWWVCCKIQPDCNISYQYIQLNQTLSNIKTTSYTKEKYPEFHKTIPFAASGTASSVLIALGEQYGLQLHVYERFNPESENANSGNGTIDKYYWFEPMKSLRPSGLKYSPNFNLQSFGLEHIGTSLSSILNVQTNTIGKDLITMIPSVPAFFRTWFETEEWANSQFVSGLFTSACQERVVNWDIEESNIETKIVNDNCFIEDKYLYIRIPENTQWDKKYDQIKFSTNGGLHSIIHIGGHRSAGPIAVTYNSKYQPWSFGAYDNNIEDNKFKSLNTPNDCLNHTVWIQLELPFADATGVTAIGTIYLSQYREPTTEELEFATIADQIPWLENRLVDFTYFYDHLIINLQQYHDVMNIFENDLRKANAKLLLYSQLYYQSIQAKTKIMANLSAQLDMVGATFQSDLMKPFQTDGRVKATTEFQLALSDLFSNKDATVELIDYYTTLADYVNKYVISEQNFLKSMYLFRQYFYEPCGLGSLYQYTWTLDDANNPSENYGGQCKYAFTNKFNDYVKLTSNNYQKDIFIQAKVNDTKKYIPFDKNEVVTDYTNSKYYYLNPKSDGYVLIDSSNAPQYNGWNKSATYYELQWTSTDGDLIDIFEDTEVVIVGEDEKTGNRYRLELSRNKGVVYISCYQHCLHTKANSDEGVNYDLSFTFVYEKDKIKKTVSIKLLKSNRIWVKTNLAEMRQNYFYRTLVDENTTLHSHRFIHRHLSDFNSLLRSAKTSWKSAFSDLQLDRKILTFLPNAKNWDKSRVDTTDDEGNYIELDNIYAECFPVTSWYYEETLTDGTHKYHNTSFVNVENCTTFARRISVSATTRANWLLWGGIAGGVAGSMVGTSLGGTPLFGATLGAGLVHGICALAWKYGDYGFGNDGWTYQDVYGNAIDSGFQYYYHGTEIVYASSEENYWTAVDDIESPTTQSLTWNPAVAAGLLFTYLSYINNKNQINDNYYYKTSYWRILTPEDVISKTDSIGIIALQNTGWIGDIVKVPSTLNVGTDPIDDTKLITQTYNRIDATVYYPLENNIAYVSGSDFDWSVIDNTINSATLGDLKWFSDTNYWLKHDNDYAILLKEEPFIYQDLSTQMFSYDTITSLASAKYYDNTTMQQVDLIKLCPDITQGYYVTGLEDDDYLPLNNLRNNSEGSWPENMDDYEIYEKIDGVWTRHYTKNQLIARNDTYVRTDNSYTYNSFSPVEEIDVQCYRYKKKNKDTDEWIFDATANGQIVVVNDYEGKLKFDGEIIDLSCKVLKTSLSDYTNAEYWYNYRNHEIPILAEKAMLIETNLTEYWTNAYYASKNCKYFLPEFWQPTVDQTKNYYSVNILSPKYEQNGTTYNFKSVDLSTTYVPVVSKLSGQNKFQFRHIAQVNDDQTIAMEQQYELPLSEHVSLNDIVEKSTPIKDIMDYLDISSDVENWVGINIRNNYVLYEHVSGGCLWTKELQVLSGNALHYPDKFGGWYDMMIKVLMSCNYKNYSPVLYKQAQQEHNQIWAQLYSQYPYLLLEQSYSNENATTSEELLKMAQYAFRDHTQVESNYNITVIDPWTLKGYRGQELQIGDGIEIDAAELYDDHDSDIYRSLIQYLYITDISYDLRKDDNIQLTVNSIKYQDKVIGQLIKLIR